MLAIERRAGESLLIGDQIGIEVLEIGRRHVKLAIRAPRAVRILRGEVADRHLPAPSCGAGERQMLIVRRRPDEWLAIGADVEVTVLGIRSSHVRVGIKARPSLRVSRSETPVPGGAAKSYSRNDALRR